MSKKIIINVSAKVATATDCVKFLPAQTITDSIEKDVIYDENSGEVLTFVNYCNVPFTISETTLYTNTENGGNLRVYVKSFTINANSQINIPIWYSGSYKGNSTSLTFGLNYNGVIANYTLNITTPIVLTPPTISNISISKGNRVDYTFVLSDFTNAFNSVNGATLSSITLSGASITNFRLNNLPIANNTEITSAQISTGLLKFLAPDTNGTSNVYISVYAKDSNNLTSVTPSTLNIANAPLCTAPTLSDVVVNENGSVTYTWNNNGISYTSGTTQLQISYDGGANYVTIGNVSPTSSPQTVTSSVFDLVSNGQNVKFRIINTGGYCTNVISNVLDRIYNKPSKLTVANITYSNNSSQACFDLIVENQTFNGVAFLQVLTTNGITSGTATFNGETVTHTHIDNNSYNSTYIEIPIELEVGTINKCFVLNGVRNTSYVPEPSETGIYNVYGLLEIRDVNGYPLSPSIEINLSKFISKTGTNFEYKYPKPFLFFITILTFLL